MSNTALNTVISVAREQELAELAEFIADEYAPKGKVEPSKIIAAKGITLSFNYYGSSFDGMLEHRHGSFSYLLQP